VAINRVTMKPKGSRFGWLAWFQMPKLQHFTQPFPKFESKLEELGCFEPFVEKCL